MDNYVISNNIKDKLTKNRKNSRSIKYNVKRDSFSKTSEIPEKTEKPTLDNNSKKLSETNDNLINTINYQFNEPCQLGLFINTVLDPTTVVSNNSGATITSGSQMLRLLTGDRIELRNLGNNIITSTLAAAGNPLLQSQNVDLTIFKIAPNRNVCGDFPIPFEKGRCCDNVEKWNLADVNQDGQISACEEKQYHRDHECPPPPPCPPVPCPPKPCNKDDKCEKKFEKLDCNKDAQLSLEEYKKGCEKRKHKHHRRHHRH